MIGHPRKKLRDIKSKYAAKKAMNRLAVMDYAPLVAYRPEDSDPEIVVSLTSYGERINTVHLAIKSILANSVKPNRIILWLDEGTKGPLPQSLEDLVALGVEVRRGVINLRAHTKYFYALKEFPEAVVITIDDDEMYPADTIKTLLETHEAHSGCVCARRVHRMTLNGDISELMPYNQWKWEWTYDTEPRMDLIALGVGAVLYPPHLLRGKALDADAMRACSLANDDIWLKVNEVIENIPVAWAPNDRVHPWTIPNTQERALHSSNVAGGQNDMILRCVLRYFGISERKFIEMLGIDVLA